MKGSLHLVLAGALAAAAGCNGPAGTDRHVIDLPTPICNPLDPNDRFTPVTEMLQTHCGSLDCHGSISRSFRVYNVLGLRLNPNDVTAPPSDPNNPSTSTTPDECFATYYSFIGIEPELTAQVIREGGAHPERLTIVRKARGSENHKGGKAVRREGTADNCLTGWLSGVDANTLAPECQAEDPRIPPTGPM